MRLAHGVFKESYVCFFIPVWGVRVGKVFLGKVHNALVHIDAATDKGAVKQGVYLTVAVAIRHG